MPTDERVLVIPTSHFRTVGYFHGYRPADDAYRTALLDPRQFSFLPRRKVETDPSFKQIIPYLAFRLAGKLFHYRRGSAGTETRLHALRSIGVGGHINESDVSGSHDPILRAIDRELQEEVPEAFVTHIPPPVGFVNDDGTPVGQLHLGVVYVLGSREYFSPADPALADHAFDELPALAARRGEFETWSRFVLDWLVTSSPPTPDRSAP